MKNILGQKEFRQLKELKSMNENMDFSNRIGWSDCLVGRAVNKFFSFVTKNIYIGILKKLKSELDDQYLKGIIIAVAKNGVEVKSDKSQLADINIILINKNDDNYIINVSELPSSNGETMTYKFEIPKNSIDDFKAKITTDENSTWVYENQNNPEFIEDLKENFEIDVTAENGTTKIKAKVEISEVLATSPQKVEEPKPEENKEIAKYEVMKELDYNKQIQMIQKFVGEFKKECAKENDYALMIRISKALQKESEQIGNMLSIVSNIAQPSDKIAIYKENPENYKKYAELLKSLSEELKNKAETIDEEKKKKKELNDEEIEQIINKAGKISLEESDNYFKEISSIYKETYNKLKDDERKEKLKKSYKRASKSLHPDTRKNYTDEQRFNDYTAFKNLVSTINEALNSNYDELLIENAFYNFEKEYETNEKVGMNQSKQFSQSKVKNLFTGKDRKKLENYKEQLSKYYDIDINKIDPNDLAKKFDENPELRKSAIDNVNKEALKEIALRAAWIYDREKYKDQNNNHYSRVNFTTTHTDAAKLKNTWLKLISKSKSAFSPFFSETNNFPESLDPIALMNSDEKFRTTWSQYSVADSNKHSNLSSNSRYLNKNPELDNKMKLVSQSLSDQQYGLISFKPKKSDKNYVLVVQKLEKSNLHIFKYIGIYDFNKIQSEIAKETDPKKIKQIIQKYNYSGYDLYSKKITDNAELSFFKDLYDAFRPTKYNLFVKKTGYVNGTDKLGTFFIFKDNPHSGPKKMFQINVIGDDKYITKSTWICKIDSKNWKVVDYEDYKNLNDTNYSQYQFNFLFEDTFKINDKDYWITSKMDILRDDKTTKMLKDDVLNHIYSTFNKI
ncbi:MAG: hypothetical protein HPY57_13410 [Ignavibacteria bacterium]|nr:hypothetical protein [Ignavibacteria bacterium]